MTVFITQDKMGGMSMENVDTKRDFTDHATFREKGATPACVDKLGGFLSLTLCNKANFDPLQ